MTPSGIEPATCRFVAQCLNHYATAPPVYIYIYIYMYVCVYIYVCVRVCLCVYVCVYIYIYIYIAILSVYHHCIAGMVTCTSFARCTSEDNLCKTRALIKHKFLTVFDPPTKG